LQEEQDSEHLQLQSGEDEGNIAGPSMANVIIEAADGSDHEESGRP